MPSKSRNKKKVKDVKVVIDKTEEVQADNDSSEDAGKENVNSPVSNKKHAKTQSKSPGLKGWKVLESDEESIPEKNVFHETIVLKAKRERPVPVTSQMAEDWITANLEAKEKLRLNFNDLYEFYVGDVGNGQVFDEKDFKELVKCRFPNGFGFKEDSIFKGESKELKMVDKTKKKVQGETAGIKMTDVIDVVLRELGNPEGGIRFHKLNTTAAAKYPALRLHISPWRMLNALTKAVARKQVVCTKGIGKCGYYRLTVKDEGDGDKPDDSVPLKKRKIQEDGDQAEDQDKSTLGDKSDKKTDERKTKISVKKPVNIGRISHSNPKRIEHALPMAFTFQSEPKIASIRKVRNYIQSYYPNEFSEKRFIRHLEEGFGFSDWERASGSGQSGSVQLTLDEWNPKYDDNMRDLIINGIMACHEPKQASSGLIRKYVEEFHPNLKVTDLNFRKAWQRGLDGKLILQLSGIGLAGKFQLYNIFEPSPANLAGEDSGASDDSDEESSYISSDDEPVVKPKAKSRGRLRKQGKVKYVSEDDDDDDEEGYSPHKHVTSHPRNATKSSRKVSRSRVKRKLAPENEETESSEDEAPKKRSKSRTPKKGKTKRGRPKRDPSSEDEESSDSEAPKNRSKSRKPKKGKNKRGRPKRDPSSEDEEEESSDGGAPKKVSKSRTPKKGKNKRGRPKRDPSSEDEKEESSEDKAPKKRSKSSTPKKGKSPNKRGRPKRDLSSEDEKDERSEDEAPKKGSKSRTPKKGKSPSKRKRDSESSEDD